MACHPRRREDGAFARQMSDGAVRALHKGKGELQRLCLRRGWQAARLRQRSGGIRQGCFAVLAVWKPGDAAAIELVGGHARHAAGHGDQRSFAPVFSKDGQRLFAGKYLRTPTAMVLPNRWRGCGTGRIRFCSRCSASARSRSAIAAIARSCTSPTSVSCSSPRSADRQCRRRSCASSAPTTPYRQEISWDASYGDVYLVDLRSGQRTKVNEHFRSVRRQHSRRRAGISSISTICRTIKYLSGCGRRPRQPDGEARAELLARRSRFAEPAAGLRHRRMDGGRSVRSRLRQVRHLGDPARRQQRPHGDERRRPKAANRLPLSLARSRAARVPLDKPLLLSANEDRTEDSGFYRVALNGSAALEKIVMVPKSIGARSQSQNAERVVLTVAL